MRFAIHLSILHKASSTCGCGTCTNKQQQIEKEDAPSLTLCGVYVTLHWQRFYFDIKSSVLLHFATHKIIITNKKSKKTCMIRRLSPLFH